MPTTFTRLPIVSANTTLPLLSRADVDFFSPYDPSSYENWLPGQTAASLTGPVNGRVLIPQSTVSYGANYYSLTAAPGSALLTDLSETISLKRTVSGVFRWSAGSSVISVLFGSMGTSAEANGFAIFLGGTEPTRKAYITVRNIATSIEIGTVQPNTWYHFAVSIDATAAMKYVKFHMGGSSVSEVSNSIAYVPATAGRKTAIGNAYYTGVVSSGTLDCADFAVFDGVAFSATDLLGLYAQRKAKMAARGIAVV